MAQGLSAALWSATRDYGALHAPASVQAPGGTKPPPPAEAGGGAQARGP
jgi:hypothetical protein